MNEFDSLIEGYPGLDDPANDPGPLTAVEEEKLVQHVPGLPSEIVRGTYTLPDDEPPHDPGDWVEGPAEIPLSEWDGEFPGAGVAIVGDIDTVPPAELRSLKPDQRPEVGKHYVIFGGVPKPVVRGNIGLTEDEFVRSNLDLSDTLKDHDGQRQVRADRTMRMRYRGYVCGEMSSL